MTLTKLAELAGVSVATVSKAFSGSREISGERREQIFKLAKENDCFDKYYKSQRERPIIALLCPEPESEHYGRQLGILEKKLDELGVKCESEVFLGIYHQQEDKLTLYQGE